MRGTPKRRLDARQSEVYEIRIRGHLGPRWSAWFEDLAITVEDNGDTLLTGPVVDQAALHGLLRKVRDLGLPLLSITRIPPRRQRARQRATSGGA